MIVKVGSTQYKTMADTNVPKPRIKINDEYLELTQDTNLAIKRPRMAVNIGNQKHYIKDVLNPVKFIETGLQGQDFYFGGALANNGNIYCSPFNASSILKINTNNDTFSTFGTGLGGNASAVLANNGMIYCMPSTSTSILKINPNNDTYVNINVTQGFAFNKWLSCTLANNGMIYALPALGAENILKINPNNDTFSTFGNIQYDDLYDEKYRDTVLSDNGMIYGIPSKGKTSVLKLNPNNDTYTTFGNKYSSYFSGALAPNGIIYSVGTNILKINTNNDTFTTFGTTTRSFGVALGNNGMVYSVPSSGKGIKINPANDTYTTFIDSPGEYDSFTGAIAVKGKSTIYSVPLYYSRIFKLTTYYDI